MTARKARDPGLRSGTPLAVEDGDFRGLYSPTYWVEGDARARFSVVQTLMSIERHHAEWLSLVPVSGTLEEKNPGTYVARLASTFFRVFRVFRGSNSYVD